MNENFRIENTIGLDLGTCNSCCTCWKDGSIQIVCIDENRTEPSIVFYGETTTLVGKAAMINSRKAIRRGVYEIKRILGRFFDSLYVQECIRKWPFTVVGDKDNSPVIRIEGSPDISVIEHCSHIINFFKSAAEAYTKNAVTHIILTVPAYFNNTQRKITEEAARIAGLTVIGCINEPTAAALAYNRDIGAERTIMIYDFGGGTFDVCIMSVSGSTYNVIGTGGDACLGGAQLTNALYDYILGEIKKIVGFELTVLHCEKIRNAAEAAKIDLSINQDAIVELDDIFVKEINKEELDNGLEVTITIQKYNELINSYVQKTIQVVEQTMSDSGISASQINDIVLVGGSSRNTVIKEFLEQRFPGVPVLKTINPDEAVAIGSMTYAVMLYGHQVGDLPQVKKIEEHVSNIKQPEMPVFTTNDGHNVNTVSGIIVEDGEEEEWDEEEKAFMQNGRASPQETEEKAEATSLEAASAPMHTTSVPIGQSIILNTSLDQPLAPFEPPEVPVNPQPFSTQPPSDVYSPDLQSEKPISNRASTSDYDSSSFHEATVGGAVASPPNSGITASGPIDISISGIPEVPEVPEGLVIPEVPEVPEFPDDTTIPEVPEASTIPEVPTIPNVSEFPDDTVTPEDTTIKTISSSGIGSQSISETLGSRGEGLVICNKTIYAYGMEYYGALRVIVPKGTELPCHIEEIYQTNDDDLDHITIIIGQGEEEKWNETMRLGKLRIDGIPRKPKGEIHVVVCYDVSKVDQLSVTATIMETGISAIATIHNTLIPSKEKQIEIKRGFDNRQKKMVEEKLAYSEKRFLDQKRILDEKATEYNKKELKELYQQYCNWYILNKDKICDVQDYETAINNIVQSMYNSGIESNDVKTIV